MEERKDYYVYGLYTKHDDKLFYIGKGTGKRHLDNKCKRRSKEVVDIIENNDIYSKILFNGLTNQEALIIETNLINSLNNEIKNKIKSSIVKKISFEEVDSLFYVDPTSPSGLRWKVKGGRGVSYHEVGDIVGCHSKSNNRWVTRLNNKNYLTYRIVWLLCNKYIDDDMYIDHIDGNPLNNSIDNLRLVTPQENARNKSNLKRNKTTGVRGLFISRNKWNGSKTKTHDYVYAYYIDLEGKKVSKMFNISKYPSEEDAINAANNYLLTTLSKLEDMGVSLYSKRHVESNSYVSLFKTDNILQNVNTTI